MRFTTPVIRRASCRWLEVPGQLDQRLEGVAKQGSSRSSERRSCLVLVGYHLAWRTVEPVSGSVSPGSIRIASRPLFAGVGEFPLFPVWSICLDRLGQLIRFGRDSELGFAFRLPGRDPFSLRSGFPAGTTLAAPVEPNQLISIL